jgi:two-component system CheB/CheR fusion protein
MDQKENKFIVAIGASAGGIKPLLTFFDSTPNDHATYIILQHLHPEFKSEMALILKKHSELEVVQAEDGILIEQNKVYMLPANMYMTIKEGHLFLHRRDTMPLYPNKAIDIFLQSLATAKGDESIAVILCGLGSDGTKGAKLIKESGGMVIAQKPESCQYSSMPVSAIKTGLVDYQLLPEEMPGTILTHINQWIEENEN